LKLTNPNERVRNLIHLTKLDTVIELRMRPQLCGRSRKRRSSGLREPSRRA
jgi:hypothetical protein